MSVGMTGRWQWTENENKKKKKKQIKKTQSDKQQQLPGAAFGGKILSYKNENATTQKNQTWTKSF